MQLSTAVIQTVLEQNKSVGRLFIAFSGGVDSHVLLHLCALLDKYKNIITAVYVHHGLQDEANEWENHCAQISEHLDIAFLRLDVNATPKIGQSPEETARIVRYQALKRLLEKDDVLLTGQHREDQMETVLLQLFRGAGLSGLSGMPLTMQFGKGFLVRPFLDVPRQMIKDYAEQNELDWVEDPSNQDISFDRNFLRHRVVPLLKERWPAIDKTVSRSSRHCAEANNFIVDAARNFFLYCFESSSRTVSIKRLLVHDVFVQQLIIREWFRHSGLRMPSAGLLTRMLSEVVAAKQDSMPLLQGRGFMLRRFRDKLYLLFDSLPVDTNSCYRWQNHESTLELLNNGRLIKISTPEAGLSRVVLEQGDVEVCYRQGGEKISLPNRLGRHTLKDLFQEAAIPPWTREKVPLIYIDKKLATVGDKWVSSEFNQSQGGDNIKIRWQQAEIIYKGNDETDIVD